MRAFSTTAFCQPAFGGTIALEAGARTQPDYLRAEAELRRARASLIRARYDEIAAVLRLARAAGALSPARLDQMLETTP